MGSVSIAGNQLSFALSAGGISYVNGVMVPTVTDTPAPPPPAPRPAPPPPPDNPVSFRNGVALLQAKSAGYVALPAAKPAGASYVNGVRIPDPVNAPPVPVPAPPRPVPAGPDRPVSYINGVAVSSSGAPAPIAPSVPAASPNSDHPISYVNGMPV